MSLQGATAKAKRGDQVPARRTYGQFALGCMHISSLLISQSSTQCSEERANIGAAVPPPACPFMCER